MNKYFAYDENNRKLQFSSEEKEKGDVVNNAVTYINENFTEIAGSKMKSQNSQRLLKEDIIISGVTSQV